MAPPRRGRLWELSWTAGVFLNLGEIGGGALGGASAVYRFDAPIVVRAELAQLGVGIGHSGANTYNGFNYTSTDNPTGSMAVAAAHLLVGLDTRFVEVALGSGGATIAAGPANGGVSIVQEGRLGARDGLAFNTEIVTVAANEQIQFGSFCGTLHVAVRPAV
jgi:hypothetical protein